jgi:hypothetical protein
MKIRKSLAAGLAALSLGAVGGIVAGTADATIGPFGGRYIQAQPAGLGGYSIGFGTTVWGNGGSQSVNTRLMRYTGSGWVQVGATKTETLTPGNYTMLADYYANCDVHGTYVYTVWSKWASYLWNNADISPGKSVTCS